MDVYPLCFFELSTEGSDFLYPWYPGFLFWDEKWSASNSLISFFKDGRMMRKGFHAFLAYVKEDKGEGLMLEDVCA